MSKNFRKLIASVLVFLMAASALPLSPILGGDRAYAIGGGIISTVAGNGTQGYSGDGTAATDANIWGPWGVAVDADGNLYFSEYWNHTVRKVDTNGNISTVAGNGTEGFSGDGGSATSAQLSYPNGIAVDASGNLYIADNSNKRVRKVDHTTGIISTVAGNGDAGYTMDGDPATSTGLDYPNDVAVDGSGNLYIVESNSSAIRKVDAVTGNISTVAGYNGAAYGGDGGPATAASLKFPMGIIVDDSGNLFIADTYNHVIRRVDAAGNISTIAGTGGSAGFSGDGGPATAAQLKEPYDVALDSNGNLYIADYGNFCVRMVDTNGNISTVAGIGESGGYSGDGGGRQQPK